MSGSTSPEYEDRYLMATVESMLRAGHGHKEIERALRRTSRDASGDSGRLAVLRSLRRPVEVKRHNAPVSHAQGASLESADRLSGATQPSSRFNV